MSNCFVRTSDVVAIPIVPVVTVDFDDWITQQDQITQNWIKATGFKAKSGQLCLISDAEGNLSRVLFGLKSLDNLMDFGVLPTKLNEGVYKIDADLKTSQHHTIATAWGLGSYRFSYYKAQPAFDCRLLLDDRLDVESLEALVDSIYLVRDLINTPTDDMGPAELASVAQKLADDFGASFYSVTGEDLLSENYPTIYAVGRASAHQPRLIDLRWGSENHPKITLVGKGVCFDTGGLNLKPASGMRYMKKDMAGAANVLGLARMIMATKLPVRLRVLIPAVENAVSGRSYHPGDVLKTRKGLTVEVTNTDAEGRLVLCDALTEAATEQPELLINIATLTGAARVAVGTDISALFSRHDDLANKLYAYGEQVFDPIWRLPMYEPYKSLLDSSIADISNANTSDAYGGAITAALYLGEFVPKDIPWVHFDIMAWNNSAKAARPEGGEAMAIRAVFLYLKETYQ